ncbi:hypothetical protein [Thermorudis peleae]|uniref:hypothetical protein n=1 Tax=Thermorudis peleae TaxID=1382356 RepID=UPI0006908175|nr:hypothetical protein [Thermorudis peleae]
MPAKLYIWLDRDPLSQPPDYEIDDIPGRADLAILAEAVAAGKLGSLLPTKLALSRHARPETPAGYRRIDVRKLLRDYRIPYRTRYQLIMTTSTADHTPQRQTHSPSTAHRTD